MNSINTTNWKWFKISDIFQTNLKIIKYSSEPEEKGKIPFVTSTSLNNGVNSFVNEKISFNKKCLTISTNGQCFDVFLQDYGEFCISSDVEILYNSNLSTNQLLFLATIIKQDQYRWGFGRKPKNKKVFSTKIKLPINQDGNPDWDFMENYIKVLREREREDFQLAESYSQVEKKTQLDVVNWKKFIIDDIFEIKNGFGITKKDIEENIGSIPAIQGGEDNEGVLGYLKPDLNFLMINEPCLTLSRVGSAGAINFFENGCYIGDKAKALILKKKYSYYKHTTIYLFLKVVLNANKFRWSYGRGIVTQNYKDLEIVLPIKSNGDINFDYIKEFMRERERGIQAPLWSIFKLENVFCFRKGKCSNAPELIDGNEIPYIGAKKNENGVMKYVKKDQQLISSANCISFICQGEGSNGYQNYFDIKTIQSTSNILGYNEKLNSYNALFIITILDLERPKWSFGRGRSPKLGKTKITLPITDQGKPNWEYMENYIKSLPYSKYL